MDVLKNEKKYVLYNIIII